MYFLYVSRSHKKILVHFFRVFPPENGWLTWPMVLFVEFTRIEDWGSLLHCCCLMMISDSSYNRLFTYTKSSIFVKKILNFWKVTQGLKNASPVPPKWFFLSPKFFLCLREIWAKCFLQKTALDLVKYGLHSATYNLQPHIGGRHSVLYFTIQAAKKYS